MIRTRVLPLMLLPGLLLAGCRSAAPAGSPTPSPAPSAAPEAEIWAAQPIGLSLQTAEGETLELLDASGSQVLFAKVHPLREGEDGFREEGYSTESRSLILWDRDTGETLWTRDLEAGVYCSGAALTGAEGVAWTLVHLDAGAEGCPYEVLRCDRTGGDPATLRTGACLGFGEDDPKLADLDGTLAVSWYDPDGGSHGVDLAETDEARTVLKADAASTLLIPSGDRSLCLFAAKGQDGTVLCQIDGAGNVTETPVGDGQIYGACPLTGGALVSAPDGLRLLDPIGVVLAQTETELSRLCSGGTAALGNDEDWQTWAVVPGDGALRAVRVDLPAAYTQYRGLEDGSFLAWQPEAGALYLIQAPEL